MRWSVMQSGQWWILCDGDYSLRWYRQEYNARSQLAALERRAR